MANDVLEQRRAQMYPKLTAAQINRLQEHAEQRDITAGEVLLEAGAPVAIFVVLTGSVEVLIPDGDIRNSSCGYSLLTELTAGHFSGEMSALRGTPGLVRLRVRESGTVLFISSDALQRLVQFDAELSELFMRAFILRHLGLLRSGHSEVTLLGSSHSGDTLRIREFLTRNTRPYVDIDLDSDVDAQGLLERFHLQFHDLPVVVCRGERLLRNPTNELLADCLGINAVPAGSRIHDLLIIGAGPAGLAAAVYAASEGLDVRLVDTFAPGGQAGTSSRIENYLGFPTGISGGALAARALSQALKFGARLSVAWSAVRLHCDDWPYGVEMSNGQKIQARAIVIASGARYHSPDLADLPHFIGNGVYYAATHLEAQLCGNEEVIVVGGGNSAGQAAVFLSGSCRHIHLLVRSDGLSETMSSYLIHRIDEARNITLHTRTQITTLEGSGRLERVTWSGADGVAESHEVRHVFLMTGASPNTQWLRGCVALDERDFGHCASWPRRRKLPHTQTRIQ